ncbi:MAG: hypothetical protein R3310_03415 [Candidatus Competibacteraceae bacterium]|nr:hypothetical protein [Candidatus Competibacteraceae bacterium]
MSPEADRLINPAAIVRPSFGNVRDLRVFYSPLGSGDKIIGFSLTNTGSDRVNPTGPRMAGGVPKREYRFRFRQRARQNIFLQVHEFAIPNGRDSETSMYSSLYFFPRKVLPSVRLLEGQGIEVTLPTGEKVVFDQDTKEIIKGVLDEYAPIDTSPNRHARHFARVAYRGKGVLIRINQRGETPETEYIWGRSVAKFAEISYRGRSCKVRANKLWYQDQDRGSPYFLYPTDEEFRDKILIPECGWPDVELEANSNTVATLSPQAAP